MIRSGIGRTILAGYLAIFLLLSAFFGLATPPGRIVQSLQRLNQESLAASAIHSVAVTVERRFFGLVERAVLGGRSTTPEWKVMNRVVALSLQRVRDRARDEDRAKFNERFDATLTADAAFVGAARAFEDAAETDRADRLRHVHRAQVRLREAVAAFAGAHQDAAAAEMRSLDWYTDQVWLPRFLSTLAEQGAALNHFNRAIIAAQRMEAAFTERGAAMIAMAIDPAAGYGAAAADAARRTREAQVEIQSVSLRPESREPLTDVLEALFHFDALANLANFTLRTEGPASYRDVLGGAFLPREAAVSRTFQALNATLEVERADIRSNIGAIGDAVLSFLESLVVIAVSTLGAGLLIAAIVTRSVAAPLASLSEALRRVRGGDLDVRVDPDRSYRETAQMALAFNAMVDEMRSSRQKLDEAQRLLEERVAERTRQLEQAQAQLVHAEKLRALGELVAGVAHELNNPLTSVLGYADLITLEAKLPDEVRREVAIIVQEAERARRIVQNLLLFARQRAHEWDWVDLNAALEQTLNLRRYHLQTRGVEVATSLDPELPAIRGDRYQLQQVFLNLVNNAFQALGGRAGRLEIRSSRGGDHVVVEFLDSGPGIAPEHMHRIFDPFFTTKPLGEGTGLGLSISYGIVQQHRGSIAAYNRPEGGAVFVIELPIQGPGEPEESPDRSGDAEFAVAPSSSDQHT